METPRGIAKFDSATAMALALARFLEGRDFSGLGQSRFLRMLVSRSDWLPRSLREHIFAVLGAREGVPPDQVDTVSTAAIAEWLVSLYPKRRYPAVMIGSSNGALVHVGAALGAPWLPQTLLTLVRQAHVHPDDPVHAMETERRTAQRFLAANPDSQLHHLHDPSQDRLMLRLITYYRSKYRRLPPAYVDFVERSLEPKGTLYLIECEQRWPTTRLGERYVYQFGAVGGPTIEEYFHGSNRVADYLARYNSPVRCWNPPPANEEGPEAEWGFEPAMRDDVIDVARKRGYRVVRIVFGEPESPSALVADFHRSWLEERGISARRLVIESFVFLEPYWTLRTGSVPYWMIFNMQPSLDGVHRYLDHAEPYDEIFLMLFAHGINSVGLPPIDAWRDLLNRAQQRGAFLGLDPDTYPAHFAAFGRYSRAVRKIPSRYPLPPPLPLERVERFIEQNGARHGVRLERIQ